MQQIISKSQSASNQSSSKIEINFRQQQMDCYVQFKRFNVIVAHRRFSKTVLAVLWLILKAIQCDKPRPQVHYFAPSYAQAKRVAWNYVKDFTRTLGGTTYNEQELKATLINGATIQLGSGDNPDASRGIYSDAVVLDEVAQ